MAAVDHVAPQCAGTLDDIAEVLVHLGRAARDVERLDTRAGRQQLEHAFGAAAIHHLRALRSRLDVAVMTGEVAAPADVEL